MCAMRSSINAVSDKISIYSNSPNTLCLKRQIFVQIWDDRHDRIFRIQLSLYFPWMHAFPVITTFIFHCRCSAWDERSRNPEKAPGRDDDPVSMVGGYLSIPLFQSSWGDHFKQTYFSAGKPYPAIQRQRCRHKRQWRWTASVLLVSRASREIPISFPNKTKRSSPFFFWRVEHTTLYISAGNSRQIDHAFVHPDYNPITYDNNIAVLEVDRIIPTDHTWVRPVYLPQTPSTFPSGKYSIAFPVGASLKPYMAEIVSDDVCAKINGNTNVSTNTLMCIDKICAEHDCNAHVSGKCSLSHLVFVGNYHAERFD